MKNSLFYIFCAFALLKPISGNTQVTLKAENIAPFGSAFLEFTDSLSSVLGISWQGPNGFSCTGSWTGYLSEPGEYCVTVITNSYCVIKGCIYVPKCKQVQGPGGITIWNCTKGPGTGTTPPIYGYTGNPNGGNSTPGSIFFDRVFPNPLDSEINLEYQSQIAQDVQLTVSNQNSGLTILSQTISAFSGSNSASVQIAGGVSPGSYVFSLTDSNGITVSKQAIKQ